MSKSEGREWQWSSRAKRPVTLLQCVLMAGAVALPVVSRVCLSVSSLAHVLFSCSVGSWCFCLFCLSYHSGYNDQVWITQTGFGFVVLHPSIPKWWDYRHGTKSGKGHLVLGSFTVLFCFSICFIRTRSEEETGTIMHVGTYSRLVSDMWVQGQPLPSPAWDFSNIWLFSFSRAATWMQAWSWKPQLSPLVYFRIT